MDGNTALLTPTYNEATETALHAQLSGPAKVHAPHARLNAPVPYQSGDLVVVSKHNAVFPQLCPKCGAPATKTQQVKLSYTPSWVHLLIFTGLLLYGIVGAIISKKATVQPAVCDSCRKTASLFKLAGLVGLLVLLFAVVVAASTGSWFMTIFGVAAFLGGVTLASTKGKVLYCKTIKDDIVTLRKTHPSFRAVLPTL